MKLSSLLLSSAAVLVAGSAFAADLPSKKAAPAAAITACKVGDVAGFTLPGGDSCLNLSGRVTYDISRSDSVKSQDGSSDYSLTPGFRINADVRTNTEIGVVRSFIRLQNGDFDKAYIQFAGVTAGKKSSLTDVFGTTANQNPLSGNPGQGVDYQISAGDFGFGLGVEEAKNNNNDKAGDRPDIVAQISGKAGPAAIKLAAASHQSFDNVTKKSHDGYAVKGSVAVALGQFNLIGFGGSAEGASAYIGGTTAVDDFVDGKAAKSNVYGGEINATFGKLLVAFEAANYENKSGATTEKVTEYDLYASYTVAKGLTIQPEYTIYNRTGGGKDENTVYLRIQRDF